MSEHTKDREMTMTIDNLEDSYLREHATASDGSRWVSLKLTNETIASMQAEINQLKARNAELEQQLARAERTEAAWGRRCIRDAKRAEKAEQQRGELVETLKQASNIFGGIFGYTQDGEMAAFFYRDFARQELGIIP